jgi:hypothetical protein
VIVYRRLEYCKKRISMTGRKGQITVFIVLGIVILISVLGYLFLIRSSEELAEREIPVIKEVPLELRPINNYIEWCIEEIGVSGLKRLGEQGGYIDPRGLGMTVNSMNPTESDAVEFFPGVDMAVPYWFHMRSANTCAGMCAFAYGMPNLYRNQGEPSVEGQLDEFLEDNLESCLQDWEYFKEQGYSVDVRGSLDVSTLVLEREVGFYVKYPLRFTREGTTHEIDEFLVRVPLNMKSIFEQAMLVTNLQAEYNYVEKQVLNLLVGFSGVNSDRLPPMAASDFGIGPGVVWSKTQVKELVVQMLSSYIQAMQVWGSRDYHAVELGGDELSEGLFNSGMLVYSDENDPMLSVGFNYLDVWPVYFDLNCQGEVCRPETVGATVILPIGIQRYNFLYDLSYPVLVSISDPEALDMKGYEFQFMLEGNIRDNAPLNGSYVPLVSAIGVEESMLCDADKRNSGPVALRARDAASGELLDGVEVMYSCAEESCPMGASSEGVLETQFPVCLGGIVSFIKEGYLGKAQWLSTELEEEQEVEVSLYPLNTLEMEVEKFKVVKSGGWSVRSNPVMLDDRETATITLERVGELGDEAHSVTLQYTNDEAPVEVSLAPGTYRITAQVLLDDTVTFLPDERCEGSWWHEECFNIPEEPVHIEPFPSGGLEAEYTFTLDEVQRDRMTLYVINPDVAGIPIGNRVIEDMEQAGKVAEYSAAYKNMLRPKFR